MNKRLKYDKYRGMDNIITIDLHNGYTTIAIIGKDENDAYDVRLMLKENTVDTWTLIEKAEHLTFNATDKTIYSAILKTVGTYSQKGFFDYYINRYEYELKCFDIGNDIMEKAMFCNVDYRYFDKARQVATLSDFNKFHIGCVAVYQGQIIGVGFNYNKTLPTQNFYNKYCNPSDTLLPKPHAEISCLNQIRNLDINFSKVKLYIYCIRKDQPCPSCMAAIKDLGIKEIFYMTNDGYGYEKLEKNITGGVE